MDVLPLKENTLIDRLFSIEKLVFKMPIKDAVACILAFFKKHGLTLTTGNSPEAVKRFIDKNCKIEKPDKPGSFYSIAALQSAIYQWIKKHGKL